MVKRVYFGDVLVVLRYNLFFTFFVYHSSFAGTTLFENNYLAYANKIEECNLIAQSNVQDFPNTPWFESLDKHNKKMVILYLSIDNRDNCSKSERYALKASEYQLSPQQQKLFEDIGVTKDPEHIKYIKGLDYREVKKIQSIYGQPFDSIKIGEKLKLLN